MTVTVRREREGGRVVEAHLSQKVLDPGSRGSTFDQPATDPATAPAMGGS